YILSTNQLEEPRSERPFRDRVASQCVIQSACPQPFTSYPLGVGSVSPRLWRAALHENGPIQPSLFPGHAAFWCICCREALSLPRPPKRKSAPIKFAPLSYDDGLPSPFQ